MLPTELSLGQFSLSEPVEGYWRVVFDNPPINLMNAQTAAELQVIVTAAEDAGDALRAVVISSANPEFFFARYDFSSGGLPDTPGPTGLPPFLDMTVRLSELPAVTIAHIRGRARGGGLELALACDLRFASTETAVFGQPEVGSGLIPGGGGIERLSQLVGRARALEIITTSADFDALTAERYGLINRAVADADLDATVDDTAARLAGFDSQAISAAKRMVDRRSLPSPTDLVESQALALQLARTPGFAHRFAAVRQHAASVGADFDRRTGYHLSQVTLPAQPAGH